MKQTFSRRSRPPVRPYPEQAGRRRAGRRVGRAGLLMLGPLLLLPVLAALGSVPGRAAPEPVAQPAPPKLVLALYPADRMLPANTRFDEALRRALAAGAAGPIEVRAEFLDQVRFPARHEERMLGLLREKYAGRPPDLMVALASPALDFFLRHRSELFPGVPIVFAGLGLDTLEAGRFEPGVTGVRSGFDAPATLRLALRLHPGTRRVFLITGPGRLAGVAADTACLAESGLTVPVSRLAGGPLTRLVEELASLPARSLVFDLSGLGLHAGAETSPEEELRRITQACPAPIYGALDPLVQPGQIGAVTTPMDEIGRATAALALQVLHRNARDPFPAVQRLPGAPLFDWREMRRWNLRASELPPGSLVRFRPRSFWHQHLAAVITLGGLFLLQSGLILALVLQSRRRQRAELEARRRREELAHMTRVATMGELTASLAHEINQPLAAILSNAQAAQRLLGTDPVQLEEIREILADVASDGQRAGEVIRRMRALLRKGESTPSELDLNELVEEVVGLVRGEMTLQNVALELELSPGLGRVQGDRVQLQQVLLNLLVNALDAMRESPGAHRHVVIRTAATGPRTVEVAVQDSGVGVPEESLGRIFEPFVTTKHHGMGLGLAICRSIIEAHGGRMGFRNNPGRGATFWFALPALEEAKA